KSSGLRMAEENIRWQLPMVFARRAVVLRQLGSIWKSSGILAAYWCWMIPRRWEFWEKCRHYTAPMGKEAVVCCAGVETPGRTLYWVHLWQKVWAFRLQF